MTPVTEGRPEAALGLPASVWRPVATVLAVTITVIALAWSAALPRMVGLSFYPQQFLTAIVGLALPLAFLIFDVAGRRRQGVLPWYDALAAVMGGAACMFVTIYYPVVINQVFLRPMSAWLPGLVITLLILDALRRTTGWSLVVIMVVFIIYGLFGDLVPGRLAGRPQDWQVLSGYMAYDINGIFGQSLEVATAIVVAFIFFGALLTATGGSKFFTDASLLLMGRFRGGSMKIAVVSSALFGSISGSAVANVVATGVITIPMIIRDKYPPAKAAAIEAVASTGGQVMPPVMGAAAFIMAEFLQVPYADVALAALVPSLLFYGALFIQADLEAAKLGIRGAPKDEMPSRRTVIGGFHFVVAFGLMIYAMFSMNWLPERAALLACVSVVVSAALFGYSSKRASVRTLLYSFVETGESVVEIIVISAAAGIVIGVMSITGLSFNLTYWLVQFGGGSATTLLLMSAFVCFLLGLGLPTLAVYLLLASLVAPAMVQVGIHPMAAHMFVLYYGMLSMITPPIALASFAAATIAKCDPNRAGWESVRFGWSSFVIPFMFVYSPTLLLIGDPWAIAWAITMAASAIWLISAALAGYFAERLSYVERGVFVVAGLLALLPVDAFSGAIYFNMGGFIMGLAAMIIAYAGGRRTAKQAAS